MTLILKIFITVIGFASVCDGERTANMLRFDGEAQSEYFTGTTIPGGVDTQRYCDGEGTLSARYMLEGVDCAGDSCRIFIQNDAVFGEPFTHPTIITDSRTLNFLNTSPLLGQITEENGRLTILIYKEEGESGK